MAIVERAPERATHVDTLRFFGSILEKAQSRFTAFTAWGLMNQLNHLALEMHPDNTQHPTIVNPSLTAVYSDIVIKAETLALKGIQLSQPLAMYADDLVTYCSFLPSRPLGKFFGTAIAHDVLQSANNSNPSLYSEVQQCIHMECVNWSMWKLWKRLHSSSQSITLPGEAIRQVVDYYYTWPPYRGWAMQNSTGNSLATDLIASVLGKYTTIHVS